jgi:deazaflavin-dependent oxidoreductase (nitroreductase family)
MTIDAEEGTMTTAPTPGDPASVHYKRPDWFTRNVMNRVMNGLTRLGVSVRGSRVLEHRGRTSGELHHTPVNLLTLDGTQYLVAPRGETQWVRNVRSAGGQLVLILGRRRQLATATEIPPAEAVPVLRAYLRRWKFETGMFFDGVSPDSTDAEWADAAPRHPVFAIS